MATVTAPRQRRRPLASGFDDEPERCLPGMLTGYINTERPGFSLERVHTTRWGTRATLFRAVCDSCAKAGVWRHTPKHAHSFSESHRCASLADQADA